MNKRGVSNIYLKSVLNKTLNRSAFTGVFSSNTLPIRKLNKSPDFFIIVNLSPTDAPGTHFVCLVKRRNTNVVMYYDSLALSLEFIAPNLRSTIGKLEGKIVKMLQQPVQDVNSVFCGFFCLQFILSKSPSFENDALLKRFSTSDLRQNDEICINNICTLIRNRRK